MLFLFCDCFNFLFFNLLLLYIVCILYFLNFIILRFGGFFLDFIFDFSYLEVGIVIVFMK